MRTPFDAEMQTRAAEALERQRETVERGEAGALVGALELMQLYDLPMPEWLRQSIGEAISRYTRHEVGTLDEAFQVVRPAGYRRPAAATKAQHGPRVARDIQDLVLAGAVVDDGLFEAVGSLHGIGKTVAKKWFYESAAYAIERQREAAHRLALPEHLEPLRGQVNWKT